MIKRLLTLATHRIYTMPILVIMPHSRCNCRCVMCDIWKANQNKKELTAEELEKHLKVFKALRVREIVFSGGEALMHSNLWKLCELLKNQDIKLTLLSTGLLLEKNAKDVVQYFDQVIVSLDGSEAIHDGIRNIPDGYRKIAAGINALKTVKPSFRVTARCVLQRLNFADFVNTVRSAKGIRIDQISFLAADIATSAFNHTADFAGERLSEIALSKKETAEFENLLRDSFQTLKPLYENKFIAESPEKMLKILGYYKAVNNLAPYPGAICNAPWVSAVIESNGDVMPCFFHKPYGNIYHEALDSILNSRKAIDFRRHLDTRNDPVCQKCVCSLKLGVTQMN
jgi:MoaA/NifB/PqqE/SkfB family radical SAM enzyme